MQQLLRVISIYSISIPFFYMHNQKEFDVKTMALSSTM